MSLLLALLAILVLAASCAERDSLPGSGSIDGLLLGLELGLDLAELAAALQQGLESFRELAAGLD